MSRFYGSLQGSRGEATRCGTPSSGVEAHVRGWDVGIVSKVFQCSKCGGDAVQAYVSGGSNGNAASDGEFLVLLGLTPIEFSYCPTCDSK